MKLPTAIYVAGSFWLFSFSLSEFNKAHMENASTGIKSFNLFMLVWTGKMLYNSIKFSEYLSM